MVALGVPVTAHLLAVALAVAVALPASTRGFLPRGSARLDEAGWDDIAACRYHHER